MDESRITWSDLRPYVTLWTVAAAIVTLVATLWVVSWLFVEVPVLRVSVWSLFIGVIKSMGSLHVHPSDFYPVLESGSENGGDTGGGGVPMYVKLPFTAGGLLLLRVFVRAIPSYAHWEERMFRRRSQHDGLGQRIRVCVLFGLVHFANIVYPLAVCIALIGAGGVFLASYLRAYRRTESERHAVLQSTALHSVYNVLAIGFLAAWMLYALWA